MNRRTLSRSLARGAAAGLAATLPMTVVMLALHRLLPRPERYPLEPYRITRRMAHRTRVGRHMSHGQLQAATAVAHFGYGAAVGALYGPLLGWVRLPRVLGGLVYGSAVWPASYLGLLPAIGILSPATKHPARRNALMIAAHLVWGAALDLLYSRF